MTAFWLCCVLLFVIFMDKTSLSHLLLGCNCKPFPAFGVSAMSRSRSFLSASFLHTTNNLMFVSFRPFRVLLAWNDNVVTYSETFQAAWNSHPVTNTSQITEELTQIWNEITEIDVVWSERCSPAVCFHLDFTQMMRIQMVSDSLSARPHIEPHSSL